MKSYKKLVRDRIPEIIRAKANKNGRFKKRIYLEEVKK
jgi:predicted house-cleaning noncanonical NTP pyrophosphatase (MazG superfamily)